MRLLVLGGTTFLGRHVVESALGSAHEVTLFNRGTTNRELFGEVEKLVGDRNGDLSALEGGRWDAVIDTSGYLPRQVRASAQMLRDSVTNYCFISSISVYAAFSEPLSHEDAPLAVLEDPGSEDIEADYGPLKARCEDAVREIFEDAALIVRPGLIVGPHDPTGRFTYWVTRLAEGGEVLAPGAPEAPVQVIDARDLADWMIAELEDELTGTFNATGPEEPLAFDEALAACEAAVGSGAELVWVDEDFLASNDVEPWSDLPLWAPPEMPGLMTVDISKALAAGLRFRPLEDTARDTHEWARSSAPLPGEAGLDRSREKELIEAWKAR